MASDAAGGPLDPRTAAYLLDILNSARLARSYVAAKEWNEFQADRLCQDAVVRRLEILGEAARRIPEETRDRFPALPWRQMIGMRNRMIHQYDQVDLQVVWDTIQQDLPGLIVSLEAMLPSEPRVMRESTRER